MLYDIALHYVMCLIVYTCILHPFHTSSFDRGVSAIGSAASREPERGKWENFIQKMHALHAVNKEKDEERSSYEYEDVAESGRGPVSKKGCRRVNNPYKAII